MNYRSRNIARLAGAALVPAALAVWGVLSTLATGGTTAATWALCLAFLFPASAVVLVVAREGKIPWRGAEYVDGFCVGVTTLAAGFLGLVALDSSAVRAWSVVGVSELVAVAVAFALVTGLLAMIDARFVERPKSAARLEAEYLKNPDDPA